MESKRIEEKNRLWNRIDLLNIYIKKDSSTIERLGLSEDSFKVNQVKKLSEKNNERKEEIITLKQRIIDVNGGLYDKELYDRSKNAQIYIDQKTDEIRTRKEEEKKEKEEINKQAHKYYKFTRESDRETRAKKRDIERTYKYYMKNCNSIPDYMLNKLKNMPNNKGYIWRGIQVYGELPAEKNAPTVLFEKRKDLMIIHEWNKKQYKIWHKKGKSRKTLHSNKAIRDLNGLRQDIASYL